MTSEESLRTFWQSKHINLETNTYVIATSEGELVSYALYQHNALMQAYLFVYVSLAHRGHGIGTHLLHLIEERTSKEAPTGVETVLTCRVSGRNKAAQRVLERAGYTRELSFSQMEIKLDKPPPIPQWPLGIIVRPFVIGQDEQAVYEADEEASQDKGYHRPMTFEEWKHRMGIDTNFDPTFWFLAFDSNEIAGICLNIYALGNGVIDHLGIRRPWRRKGLGMALLQHSFGDFYRRDIHKVVLNVDAQSLTGAGRLYERAGMHEVQQYYIYKKAI